MSMLAIAGIEFDVLQSGASEDEPFRVGTSERMFSGLLRSTVRVEKRQWSYALGPLTAARYEQLFELTKNGAQVIVSGAMMVGSPLCTVELSGADYVPAGTGFRKIATIRIREV